jgi:hypothetical protein
MAPMTIPNHISVDDFVHMAVGEIVALPAEVLANLQQEIEERLRLAKTASDWLNGALVLKYAERARQARGDGGKDFGAARFTDGEVTIVADLPKKVDWDQFELAQLVERIKADGEDPREYIDVSLKVSERKFAAWPGNIRSAFTAARTVRSGSPSFKLKLAGAV